jgi:DNA-binding XRE family transcriptional regulator
MNGNFGMMVSELEQELDALAVVILPETLRALRENYIDPKTGKMGLTQSELAQILGVTKSAVTKYESSKHPSIPQSHVLAKMCILYNTELFFSPDPHKRHPALPKVEQG